jgi:hypothetical protein
MVEANHLWVLCVMERVQPRGMTLFGESPARLVNKHSIIKVRTNTSISIQIKMLQVDRTRIC